MNHRYLTLPVITLLLSTSATAVASGPLRSMPQAIETEINQDPNPVSLRVGEAVLEITANTQRTHRSRWNVSNRKQMDDCSIVSSAPGATGRVMWFSKGWSCWNDFPRSCPLHEPTWFDTAESSRQRPDGEP